MNFQNRIPPEKLSKLPLVYGSPTVTAGNAPGLDTGASAILIMSEKKAKEKGLKPLAKIISMIATATTPRLIVAIPGFTILKALEKAQMDLNQIGLIEIQEAFAVQALADAKLMGLKSEDLETKVNVNGSGISLGHPIGATGVMRLVTLVHEMVRRQVKYGLLTICGGGGLGICTIVERR